MALTLAFLAASATGQTSVKSAAPASPQKPAAGPPAPQSKHYPILLIGSGAEPFWSLRIGMKGPETLDRAGYPPILLEPGDTDQDPSGEAWLYHAKDTATGAELTARVSREPCSDNMSDIKYPFRVVVTHAQIGEFHGCARIAPDQFPEFKQKNLDDVDPEKKKITTPPITNFKPPVAFAYLDAAGKVVLLRGGIAKIVAAKGSQLCLSHDGKRLLFTREDSATDHAIVLYDAANARATDLLRGQVQSAYWSPDDSRIAFAKSTDNAWHAWTMPSNSPDQAAQLASTPIQTLQGWQDAHTVLATDAAHLYFLKTDSPPSSLDLHDVYGGIYQIAASDHIRANPANPDLLVIAPSSGSGGPAFLFEVKSRRRVPLTPAGVEAASAEWSLDGIQVFFTVRGSYTDRIFWDGSGLRRFRTGSALVVGQ